jgi:hypothetical protein
MTWIQYAIARVWTLEGIPVPENYATPECSNIPIDPDGIDLIESGRPEYENFAEGQQRERANDLRRQNRALRLQLSESGK